MTGHACCFVRHPKNAWMHLHQERAASPGWPPSRGRHESARPQEPQEQEAQLRGHRPRGRTRQAHVEIWGPQEAKEDQGARERTGGPLQKQEEQSQEQLAQAQVFKRQDQENLRDQKTVLMLTRQEQLQEEKDGFGPGSGQSTADPQPGLATNQFLKF